MTNQRRDTPKLRLLTAEDGAFRPEQRVAKHRVIQIWKQAAAQQE